MGGYKWSRSLSLVLALFAALSFGGVAARAEEDEASRFQEEVEAYVGQGAEIRDGLLIDEKTHTLIHIIEPMETLVVPGDIENIGTTLYDGIYLEQLRTVILSEGVRRIEDAAFYGAKELSRLELPTTLQTLEADTFCIRALDTLLIPRNTQMLPSLDSEWYGTLLGTELDTLVFCGTETMFFPTEFKSIAFPLDGSGRLVFWGEPPEHIDLSDLFEAYRQGGDNGWREQSGPYTICYPPDYAYAWAPNGEERWHSLPIRMLTAEETAELVVQSPKLFHDVNRIDHAAEPGWNYDLANNVNVFTEAGWADYQSFYWGMEIAELRIAEGIERVARAELRHDGLHNVETIVADTLVLPSTVRQVELANMEINGIEVSEENRYVHMEEGKLIETRSGKVLWEAPARPHPTAYLGEPLTEEEIAARQAEAAAYREAATRAEPTATPAPEPAATAGPEPAATPTPLLAPLSTPVPTAESTATSTPAPLPVSAAPGQGAGAPAGPDPVILLLAGIALAAVALAVVIAARYRRRK